MPDVPFRCPKCGALFGGGIRIEGDATDLTLVNSTMTCPRCGTPSPMALPDGKYNVRAGRFELVQLVASAFFDARPTWTDVQRLAELLTEAKSAAEPPEATAERIAQETPALAAIAEAIRSQRPDRLGPMIAALGVLVAVLAYLFPRSAVTEPAQLDPQQIEQVISETIGRLHPTPAPEQHRRAGRAPVRNAPCPCGSGVKYKRCHGAPSDALTD